MSTGKSNCSFRWRVASGAAVLGILACSAGVSAKEPSPIININTGEVIGTVEAVPTTGPVLTIRSIQSADNIASATGPEAKIYEILVQPAEFAIFPSFRASTGLAFPGTLQFDNMGLGAGFAPGGAISSYELRLFRSSFDFQPGLADLHIALWDGDPFCGIDTLGDGFACAPIAGSEADIVGIPANTRFVATHVLPKGVVTGVSNTANRVWMAISSSITGNPSPCRIGWIIGDTKPLVGNDDPFDVFGIQTDDDGLSNGGTCCVDELACNAGGPICAFCIDVASNTNLGPCITTADCPAGAACRNANGDACAPGSTANNCRGWCSDDFAESAGFFFLGGPCDGAPGDGCANFVATLRAPAGSTISLVPTGNDPAGGLAADAFIDLAANEISMARGGVNVFLEVRFGNWDADGSGIKLKAFQASLDSNGYSSGLTGVLTAKVVECNGLCDGGVNDGEVCNRDSECFTCSTAGTACVDDKDCPSGDDCEQLTCDTSSNPEGNETCRAAFGGACGGFTLTPGALCTINDDCPDIIPDVLKGICNGPKCEFPTGQKDQCEPGFILGDRGNYVFLLAIPGGDIRAVDLSTQDYRYGSAVAETPVSAPDPFPAGGVYAGSLVLDVSTETKGTYTVGFLPVPSSVLVQANDAFIPLIGFRPGKITIRTGQCCDLNGAPFTCMTDTITQDQCEGRGWAFNSDKSCSDKCDCTLDSQCDDGDACTVDTCDSATGQCDSATPTDCSDGLVCTDDECDPASGCSNPAVDPDDGDPCTDDACAEPGGVTNTHVAVDDGDVCTVDLCDHATGAITNTDIDTFACGVFPDCPLGENDNGDPLVVATGCVSGMCVCECSSDADCDDGDACTVNTCDPGAPGDRGDGCNFVSATDCSDGLACTDDLCDSGSGCSNPVSNIDDGDACTIDGCDEPGGITHVAIDPDDGDPCTTDSCDPAAGVSNVDGSKEANIPCATLSDCPEASTVCNSDGICDCVLCPDLFMNVVGAGSPLCATGGEKVTVGVMKGPSATVTGAQFIVTYDPSCLDFNSITPGGGGSPYTFEMDKAVDEAAGRIFYAVGVNPFGGVTGTGLTARLATLSFTKVGDCNACDLCFDDVNPQSLLAVFDTGQGCIPNGICSDDIIDEDVVEIECPGDMSANADCDFRTAMVTWDAPTASSKCGTADLECSGVHVGKDGILGTTDDLDFTALAMGGGEHPVGTAFYSCTAVSGGACPDSASCDWTVVVNDQQTLDVTLQVEPWMMGNVRRCIKFELYNDCVHAPIVIEEELWLGSAFDHVGHFTAPIKVPVGQFACITARDQLHSLRSCYIMGPGDCADGVYTAEFKGDPFYGGNWLVQGNLDGWKKDNGDASHDVIDILDFGSFIAAFDKPVSPHTSCPTANVSEGGVIHADINGDGVVDRMDFEFIARNFLASSKDCCCGVAGAGELVARTSITVQELIDAGMRDMVAADINRDGVVDMADIAAFQAGDRVRKIKGNARGGSSLRSR